MYLKFPKKIVLDQIMQNSRDVKKSQVSTTYNKKLSLIKTARVTTVPMPTNVD